MFVPYQSLLKHKTGSKDVTVVHILLFHKIRNTTELLKDPNELGCDNKHHTNGWVNLSVILIILITCIKMFLSRVVQKKKDGKNYPPLVSEGCSILAGVKALDCFLVVHQLHLRVALFPWTLFS